MPTNQRDGIGGNGAALPADQFPIEDPVAFKATEFVNKMMDERELHNLGVPAIVTLNLLQLVSNPEAVKVYITQAVRSTTLEFAVEDEDMGKVIGRGGHTIDALRSLAKSAAGSSEKEYVISLIEDRTRPQFSQPPPRSRQESQRRKPRFSKRSSYEY